MEALAELQKRRYPVLITDIRMPVMDGLELLRQCAVRFPGTKTIVLSAYDDFPLVQTAIRQGAKDYLLKPVIKTELIAALIAMKRELDYEKERTVASIARGELPESEAVSRINAYGMADWALGEAPVRFVTAEMRVPEARVSEGPKRGASFKEAYRLLMLEIASQWGSNIATFGDASQPDRMHFIVHSDPSLAIADADRHADGMIGRFLTDVREKVVRFLRIELVIGVGHPVSDYRSWSDGMASSLLALSRSKPDKVSQTIMGDDRDPEEELSLAILRRFALAVEKADESQALQALEEISETGKRSSVQAFSFFLVQLGLRMDEIVRKYDLKDLDPLRLLWPYINSSWDCDSIGNIVRGIRDMALRIVLSLRSLKHNGREDAIEAIRKYMHEHYGEELTLSSIAEQYHYNVAYLSDSFRKQTGSTFSEYLLGIRMDQASKLLQDSDLKIVNVSELTGFSSSAYFSNVFKGYYGVGPNEYRKQHPRS
jgi:two-component system response regulator YesN